MSWVGADEAGRLAEVKRMEDRLALLEEKHQRREKVRHADVRKDAQAQQQCRETLRYSAHARSLFGYPTWWACMPRQSSQQLHRLPRCPLPAPTTACWSKCHVLMRVGGGVDNASLPGPRSSKILSRKPGRKRARPDRGSMPKSKTRIGSSSTSVMTWRR